jgi:hypothetical protein
MRTPTYQDYLDNPSIRVTIERAARAERAEAVHRSLLAPLKRLWNRAVQKPSQRLQTQPA